MTTTTTTTSLADEFKDSPRYRKILAVFTAVDALGDEEPINKVMALLGRTTLTLNGIERDRLPGLVRQALDERGFSGRF